MSFNHGDYCQSALPFLFGCGFGLDDVLPQLRPIYLMGEGIFEQFAVLQVQDSGAKLLG